MSYSPSKLLTRWGPAAPRLIAAVAGSLALHTSLAFVLDGAPPGARGTELAVPWSGPGQLSVLLRAAPEDAASAPVANSLLAGDGTSAPGSAGKTTGAVTDAPPRARTARSLRYYTPKELDVRPGITMRVEPEYPEAASRRFLSGKVVVQLFLDETGMVERVVTVRAEPRGYFEDAAEKAFRAVRFTPGIKNGRPVKVRMRLEVNFDSAPPPG